MCVPVSSFLVRPLSCTLSKEEKSCMSAWRSRELALGRRCSPVPRTPPAAERPEGVHQHHVVQRHRSDSQQPRCNPVLIEMMEPGRRYQAATNARLGHCQTRSKGIRMPASLRLCLTTTIYERGCPRNNSIYWLTQERSVSYIQYALTI